MKQLIAARANALSGLALRQGLALVLFGWGYDFYFNPQYYAALVGEVTPNPAAPNVLMVVLLGLAGLLMTGLATRVAAGAAAVVFAGLLVLQGGHQPIGLPQNVGLASAAVALVLIGPGALALGRSRVAVSPSRQHWAGVVLRVGLAMTFFIYGVEKFTEAIEYRIVVAEIPTLAPVVSLLGATNTVHVVGAVELLVALALIAPPTLAFGALGQVAILLGLVTSVGYPFSYPQDLGLLAALGAVLVSGLSARPAEVLDRTDAVKRARRTPRLAPARQPVLAN